MHQTQGVPHRLGAQHALPRDRADAAVSQRGRHDTGALAGHLNGTQLEVHRRDSGVISLLGPLHVGFFHKICQQSVYSEEAICGIQGSNRDQNRGGLTERKGYVAKIDRGAETRSGQEINSGGGEAKSRKTIFCH